MISETVQPLTPVMTALNEADGLVLAENIFAPQSIPAYPQSSMDGFAFAFKEGLTAYHIKAEIVFKIASMKLLNIRIFSLFKFANLIHNIRK